MIIDSQAVKNTCNASVASIGFCFYKATNRIQQHLAVDTLGFPFFVHCTKASRSDDVGLIDIERSRNVNLACPAFRLFDKLRATQVKH